MPEECNVDDILCQVGVLQNLRGLQKGMGNEAFLNDFPELQGLDGKLIAKIESDTESLKAAIAKCGQITPEVGTEEVIVKPLGIVSIEEASEE